MTEEALVRDYRKEISKRIAFITLSVVCLILVVGYTCTISRDVSAWDSLVYIYNHIIGVEYPLRSEEWWNDYFIWNSILPRIVAAIVAGASLAVAGSMMQSIVANPLADPYTTGISSGASFGAVAAIVAGMSFASVAGEYGIVTNAFIGSLVPAFGVILITRYIRASPVTMILVGTAFSYIFNALTTLMMITASDEDLQSAFLWQIGSLNGMMWDDVPLMFVVCIIGSIFVITSSKKLNLMMMGEDSAKCLGLNVNQFRIVSLLMLSLMTASVISYTGIIGFVGLLVPHIVRVILGSDNRFVVVASLVMGSLVLLTADLVSRLISSAGEVPVGVIMSFVGGPVFLIIILFMKKGYGDAY
ncbi:MAG: iron ABC transporter permease [Candidatus Methanomethylophilaceae archaeon]|nr:iron ABC transporter permease [Candidatus Methanomethylophilaceae archaeon]